MKLTERDRETDITPLPRLGDKDGYMICQEKIMRECLSCPHPDCIGRHAQECPGNKR